MKPTIALTTYGRYERDLATVYHKYLFSIPAPYIDAIRRAGGIPFLLPPGEDNWDAVLSAVDGIVITGGADLSPTEYGGDSEHNSLTTIDQERDQSELSLIRHLVRGDGRQPYTSHYYGVAGPVGSNPYNGYEYKISRPSRHGPMGASGLLFAESEVRFAKVTDGTSKTYLLGELKMDVPVDGAIGGGGVSEDRRPGIT